MDDHARDDQTGDHAVGDALAGITRVDEDILAAGIAPGATGDIACAGRPDTAASANSAAAAKLRRWTRLRLGFSVPIIITSPNRVLQQIPIG